MPVPILRGPGKGCSMDSSTKKKLLDAEAIARYDPFSSHNNIRVTATYEDGSGEGELIVTRESLNPHGIVHGGCLAALADSVGGWTASSAQHRTCVTVNYAPPRNVWSTPRTSHRKQGPEQWLRALSIHHFFTRPSRHNRRTRRGGSSTRPSRRAYLSGSTDCW